MRGFSEMPLHPQEHTLPKKGESFLSKIKQSRMAKAAMVAAGLHMTVPAGIEAAREGIAHAATTHERWHGEGSVLRPQSDEVRDRMWAKTLQRQMRQDKEGLKAYEQEAAKRLEKGEDVGFEELHFRKAELAGVPHEDIEKAKKEVRGMVEHFASKLESGLTDQEIREISREMFDTAMYEWGQGSVVEYFVHHKRNCVAISQAQLIVFEKLLARLPEEQRGRFHLGKRFENQHEIAVMGVSQASDLPVDHLIILETPSVIERHDEVHTPAGTATIIGAQVKEALAGKKVIVSARKAEKGKSIDTGPRIDAVSDTPVESTILIEGPLRGANANHIQADKEKIKPMTKLEYQGKYGVMELEIQIEDINMELKKRARLAEQKMKPHEYVMQVDLRDITAPTKALSFGWRDVSKIERTEFIFGALDAWSPEALESLAAQEAGTISVQVDKDGKLPSALVKAFQSVYRSQMMPGMPWSMLELRKSIETGAKDIDDQQFAELLSTTLASKAEIQKGSSLRYTNYELKLTTDTITAAQFEILKKFPPRAVHIAFRMENIWTSANSSPGHVERDRLRKGLKALGVPVYIDLGLLGAPMPFMPDPPKEDFDWMFNDQDGIYPEFSDLVSAAIEPKSMNHFPNALYDHLPRSSKAALLESFIDQVRVPEVGRPVDHEDVLRTYSAWCQHTLR